MTARPFPFFKLRLKEVCRELEVVPHPCHQRKARADNGPESQHALIQRWARDIAADPTESLFVFAHTNQDVNELNAAIRHLREELLYIIRDETRVCGPCPE